MQASVATMARNGDPVVKHLLGATPGIGRDLGLDDMWAARAITAIGNYSELFDRDLGAHSPLRPVRGQPVTQ
jgi:general L-amino acid transport system substrate-binding protein